MKLDPAILKVHAAARRLVTAANARDTAIARCGGMEQEQAKALLTSALDQERIAFREMLASCYDQALLDLIATYGATVI